MSSIVHAMSNSKSLTMPYCCLKFNVNQMKEFVNSISKSLDYFYMDRFELHRELSTDDVVNSLRLLNQLKGYQVTFVNKSCAEMYSYRLRNILFSEFYVQNDRYYSWQFYLCKNAVKKFKYDPE